MAKGDSGSDSKQQGMTPPQPSQLPQQNQTLSGNPSTDTQAQTRWMSPSSPSDSASQNTGINGGAVWGQNQQNTPVNNGTMLGQITAGNVGQYTSGAWDQNKFNDPNKHDPKYDVGRILSKYPPSTQGLQAAMNELGPMGYRMTGKDTIVGSDGIPIDVGFAFGSGQGSAWQWNPNDPNAPSGQQFGSMLGNQQQGMNPNLASQMQYQQMLAQRAQAAQQTVNPTGGSLQFPMGQANASQQIPYNSSMLGIQQQPNSLIYNQGMQTLPGMNY